jgi:AhpD family alkylhydroperoxidase
MLAGAVFAMAAYLWLAAGGPSDEPKLNSSSHGEKTSNLDALPDRAPRIPLPPAGRGEASSGYLPKTWGGGGGLGGFGQSISRAARDRQGRYPDPRLDDLFTDPTFWVVSRANDCRYCMAHQELKLRAGGLDDDAMAALDGNWSIFNPRQQAALAYSRKLTLEPHLIGQKHIADLKASFSDAEIVELTFNIARFNSVNRWTEALGFSPERQPNDEHDRAVAVPASERNQRAASSSIADRRAPRDPLPSTKDIAVALEACRSRTPRVELPPEAEARTALSVAVSDRAPLMWERALSALPEVGKAQVIVWNTIMSDDHLPPRLKAELAYITAVNNRAWYAVGNAQQRATELGASRDELASVLTGEAADEPGHAAAYRLAAKLTTDPHLITDRDIADVREHFSDPETAQIVHVICMANLFDRFTEALGLPLE